MGNDLDFIRPFKRRANSDRDEKMSKKQEKRKQKKLKARKERNRLKKHRRFIEGVEEKRATKELYHLEREAEKLQNKAIKAAEEASKKEN